MTTHRSPCPSQVSPTTFIGAVATTLALTAAVGCQTTPATDTPATQPAAQAKDWTAPQKPEPRKTILERQSDNVSRNIRRGRY
ncbi:MAG: hypothetical protein AAF797_10325 [Planctomycetota bacterium]